MTASGDPPALPPVCILAGGLGTRLGPRTKMIPKPLVDVAGKPFLSHQLDLLRRHGAREIVLCVGYLGNLIEERIGSGSSSGLRIAYSYDGPAVIGTAAAIRQALPLLGCEFLVLYGDTYLRIDYGELVRVFRRSRLPALMAVLRNEGRWDASNAAFDGKLVRYRKGSTDPGMEWIDYGVSVLSSEALAMSPSGEPDLANVLAWLAERQLLAGYAASERFYEIGTPDGLAETEAFLSGLLDQPGHGRS